MASSCIPTGLRLPDMEMVKPAVAAAPGAAPMRPASHSTASSTLSETKKPVQILTDIYLTGMYLTRGEGRERGWDP